MRGTDELTRPVPHGLQGWKHCPVCGADVRAVQHEAGAQPNIDCGSCGRQYFANPKPCTTALAEDPQGRLLLVRRGIDPYRGYWDLPGGFMEEEEDPIVAVHRELLEETGLNGDILELLAVYPDRYGDSHASTLNLFYRMRVHDPSVGAPASDVTELRWFALDELPPDDELAFECIPRVIGDWRRLQER